MEYLDSTDLLIICDYHVFAPPSCCSGTLGQMDPITWGGEGRVGEQFPLQTFGKPSFLYFVIALPSIFVVFLSCPEDQEAPFGASSLQEMGAVGEG